MYRRKIQEIANDYETRGYRVLIEPTPTDERLPALAAELVGLGVDVIVTHGPPGVKAAMAATRTIPIVMARIDDAEEHGLVASLARPEGNITGLSILVFYQFE